MRLLLDTHALIWAAAEPSRLGSTARDAIEDPANEVLVSTASAWEVAIKAALGRLTFGPVTPEMLDEFGMHHHPIDLRHTSALADLDPHHRDPFDRMLVAQARVDDLVLVTSDEIIAAYGVLTLW